MRIIFFLFVAIFLNAKVIDFSSSGVGAEVAELSESVDSKAELAYVDLELSKKSDTSHTHDGLYESKNTNIQAHIGDKENPHEITKSQLNIENVDNTSDLNKPISTATQSALDLKVNYTDVKDNLASTDIDKPLSANQGNVLDAKILKLARASLWKSNLSNGGNITWKDGKLSTSGRLIYIPTNKSNGHLNLRLNELQVNSWQIAYIDLTDAQMENLANLTEADVTVESYNSYTVTDNLNRVVVGYRNGDTGDFVFSNGTSITSGDILHQLSTAEFPIYTYNYTASRSFGSGDAVTLFTTPQYTIHKGRDISIEVSLPLRNNTTSWGGAYINWNLNVNGTWYNLGNTGYDGAVMAYSAQMIATYRHKQVLRLIKNLGLTSNYTIQLEVIARSYNYTTYLNSSHDLNRVANNLGKRGAVVDWAKNLNYSTVYISEIPAMQ